ncbi:MAG: Cysteine desulfurase [Thermoproteota archaeon]|nr:Cysteine desulfurase [Thermoproteota archaeon]
MTVKRVYIDYAATTPLDPRVLEAMTPYFLDFYGNASSSHTLGQEAKLALENSRVKVSQLMGAKAEELIFTGSATESNNLVTKGHAFAQGKKKAHIAVSSVEHDCVLNSAKWLKENGFKVDFIPVDKYGFVRMDKLEEILKKGVTLVSVIHGNNEIGTINQLEEIGKICHEYDALFHSDAAQSFGKVPINVEDMNVDLLTVNAHKLYGPKGIGALYMKKGVKLEPLLHGGGHEFGLRSSTENVPGIVGFAKAVELRMIEIESDTRRSIEMRDKLIKEVLKIDETYLNGHPTMRLPNNTNFRFSYIDGEGLVTGLDMEGISASSGSACSSHSTEPSPSHVLLAIGLDGVKARGSLRISLGKYNTDEDIDYVLEVLPRIVEGLRRISPLTPKDKKRTC